jgi:hypothetical protein
VKKYLEISDDAAEGINTKIVQNAPRTQDILIVLVSNSGSVETKMRIRLNAKTRSKKTCIARILAPRLLN